MNRLINELYTFSSDRPKEYLVGVTETIRWTSTKWNGGPKESGEYLVSDGKGRIRDMQCTGCNKSGISLFQSYIDGMFENVRFSNNKSLTSDELIELCRSYNVWYEIDTYNNGDWDTNDLIIMTDEDKPKYFVEAKIRGPIDSELDSYDKTFVDFKGDIIPNEERKVSQ